MAEHAARRGTVSPEAAFGRVLKSIRNRRELSQDELAARSGYHRTYIGQLERGEKSPSLRTLFDLASTLDVAPSAIVRKVELAARAR
ncbi:MAG TPA: helix-turn-helix transcriptional regulator [Terriglobales bacterium]|nr:helix-turn-helix transcriptional regulator [Terriglobales bacterium]